LQKGYMWNSLQILNCRNITCKF